jgi:small subunit ribosomal protein S2
MTRLPGALFVVDIRREHIAIREAQKLNIPIFAMVDTNCDPREVDYAIPSNDDASKSIDLILTHVSEAINGGLSERQKEKEAAEVVIEKEAADDQVVVQSPDEKEEKISEQAKAGEKKKRVRKKITTKKEE